jgi:signal transduction histidine kinase
VKRIRSPYSPNIRVRVWDRSYLVTLVQQFPQIGYKYFSDEGRSRAKYRKTPEQLYEENVSLLNRQGALIAQLTEEKNMRVRAERDAVWKDISFTAAHKMGNPVFAIETYLDPLEKRIHEQRSAEAVEVVGSIRNSVERAKGIVDQFKSLTRAQEINAVPTLLEPLIQDSCKIALANGVRCEVSCPPDVTVQADPERLAECCDELICNATHWLVSEPREIRVSVEGVDKVDLPQSLDSSRRYVLVHVVDTGPGVPLENKERIFDAFFTTREHGAGLGLAVVRRIVEGTGGLIREVGIPGQGANFEMFLPLAETDRDQPTR